MNKEKLKYGHVGRPTNEEVKKNERKKTFKIVGIITLVFVLAGGIFLYVFKDKISFVSIMGNSAYYSKMHEVQKNSKIKKVVFTPDNVSSNDYYQEYYKDNKTKMVSYLFTKAGFNKNKYKFVKIQIYSNGKYIKTVTSSTKNLVIPKKYRNQTLGLKVIATQKSNNKSVVKYLRLEIPFYLTSIPTCTMDLDHVVSLSKGYYNVSSKREYQEISVMVGDKVTYSLVCQSGRKWSDYNISKSDFKIIDSKSKDTKVVKVSSIKRVSSKDSMRVAYDVTFDVLDDNNNIYIKLKPFVMKSQDGIYNIKTDWVNLNIKKAAG